MPFLVQGHCCHKRRLACHAPTPFATTALATSVDIIELNDAADGLLVIGLFHGLQQLVLEHPGGVILLFAGDRQSQSTGAVSVYQLCAARIGEADSLEKLEALLPWNVALEPISKKVVQYNEGK